MHGNEILPRVEIVLRDSWVKWYFIGMEIIVNSVSIYFSMNGESIKSIIC